MLSLLEKDMLDMGEGVLGMVSDIWSHGIYSGKVDTCVGFHLLGLPF